MPVTRSSSRTNFQQPPAQPYQTRSSGSSASGGTKKASGSKSPSNEIIVLSSDDDELPSKGTLSRKKASNSHPRKRTAASAARPVPSGGVLEISSSDDEDKPRKTTVRRQAQPPEAATKDLQRTIKKLQEELKKTEKLLASTSREVEELKRDCSNKEVFSTLEEYTSCEVCTLTMWCPYTLSDCGHSFCEPCLIDWFGTAQAQHMAANPRIDDSRVALAGQLHALVQMIPNLHAYGPHGQNHVQAVLAELRRHRPDYTCPTCRKGVLNKPVEDFRLKGLIKEIASMMGETNTPKKTSRPGTGPFDHFFAAPTSVK